MHLETILVYDELLMRQAVRHFWRRTAGAFFVPLLLASTAGFIALLMLDDLSWQTGVFGTMTALLYLISALVYVVHYRNSLAKFRALRDPKAAFHADEHSFTFESDIGKTTLRWSTIKEVWVFQDVWLLLFSKAQFSTLPVANLTPQFQQLIISSVESAGGKIR